MNLQLNSPYKPCPYQCPYCCARCENGSLFDDTGNTALYFTDRAKYQERLRNLLRLKKYDTVVITGSTEPTLFPGWIKYVAWELQRHEHKNVELATHNVEFKGTSFLKAVSYSFHEIPNQVFRSNAQITRAVFILHDGININDIIRYHQKSGGQTTVKNLAMNSYGNATVNDWVKKHKVSLSSDEINRLTEAGIRYDHDCNNSEGRYVIFRADGNLYESWQAKRPVAWRE